MCLITGTRPTFGAESNAPCVVLYLPELMAPARRSARNIGISTPSSVTTKASLSVFSGSNSQQSSPPTSDPEDQGQSKSFATTQSRSVIRPSNVVSSPLKRTRKADSENPDASDKEHRKPKRRSLARMAFVEIPKRKTSLNEINKVCDQHFFT